MAHVNFQKVETVRQQRACNERFFRFSIQQCDHIHTIQPDDHHVDTSTVHYMSTRRTGFDFEFKCAVRLLFAFCYHVSAREAIFALVPLQLVKPNSIF